MKNEKKDSKLKLKMRHIDSVPSIKTQLRGGDDITEACPTNTGALISAANLCTG